MPAIDVECPECATVLPIEEDRLGTEVKCSKCKSVFEARKPEAEAEAAYGLAEPAPRPRPEEKPGRSPSARPKVETETEAERRLRERMEKWADEV